MLSTQYGLSGSTLYLCLLCCVICHQQGHHELHSSSGGETGEGGGRFQVSFHQVFVECVLVISRWQNFSLKFLSAKRETIKCNICIGWNSHLLIFSLKYLLPWLFYSGPNNLWTMGLKNFEQCIYTMQPAKDFFVNFKIFHPQMFFTVWHWACPDRALTIVLTWLLFIL